MDKKEELAEKHSLLETCIFLAKTYFFIFKRSILNIFYDVKKIKKEQNLINSPIISRSETELWNPNDNKDNWILTAGKIENLRIAAKKLNGIEVKANQIFSFWKQIGNPNIGKGFVVGREVREGCIIPTKGGGLCQISNALYDAALKANFEIVERHKHTKIVKGSLAEQDRDATVKWNYVDLRFKSKSDFRIETELTSEKLIVNFKGNFVAIKQNSVTQNVGKCDEINDCYSCNNALCHFNHNEEKEKLAITTLILDEKWKEYDDYITEIIKPEDVFILPFKKNKFINTNRYLWNSSRKNKCIYLNIAGLYRAFAFRFLKEKRNIFKLSLELDRKLAKAASKRIPLNSKHLIISQNLLPFLVETGVLGGRTYDVIMNRLPFEKLHERLDFAHFLYEESKTLNDFRASKYLINLENKGLSNARKIISPHNEIEELFKGKIEKLSWNIEENKASHGKKILFPASSLGRKGAYEMRKIAKELNLKVTILGTKSESEDFWKGVETENFNGDFDDIGLIIFPNFIENQPRILLKGLAKKIPIITTKASGLDESQKVFVSEIGDYEAFRKNVIKMINRLN